MLGLVVSGGDCEPPHRLEEWSRRAEVVIAANGGAEHALRLGLTPSLVVGDLDSLSARVRERLEAAPVTFIRHRPDKDETDTELALRAALDGGCDEVVLLCALGGRLDHTLANVFLLALPGMDDRGLLASGDTEVRLVRRTARLEGAAGDLLTLLPFGADAVGVRTAGLAYPLDGETLPVGFARGVSNVFEEDVAEVSLQGGALLAVHLRRGGKARQVD
ncbi:MAG: thiamine diphosphokinase [Anaerolineae bacterium]|nr:thiamine diphosphokinase [Anaerolineae bacterium]